MVYDIQAITSVMDRKVLQMARTAHNIANAPTPGFKAEHMRALEASGSNGEAAPAAFVDFKPGLPEKTGNELDVRIEGDGFFTIQTKDGLAFTRRGDFTIDREGRLITQNGDPVLGDSGVITLKNGKINIGRDASVAVDGSVVGNLRIVDFDKRASLIRDGGGLFRDPGQAGMKKPARVEVVSGFIELSNVDIIREMTNMIDINRSFESYQKIIQTISDLDKLAVGRVGRLA